MSARLNHVTDVLNETKVICQPHLSGNINDDIIQVRIALNKAIKITVNKYNLTERTIKRDMVGDKGKTLRTISKNQWVLAIIDALDNNNKQFLRECILKRLSQRDPNDTSTANQFVNSY